MRQPMVSLVLPITPTQARAFNGSSQRTRIDTRADAVLNTESPIVRRIGHVVLGTPRDHCRLDWQGEDGP